MAKLTAQFDYSDEELLALVKEAIAQLAVGGQSYTIGNQSYTRGDLTALLELREDLERRIGTAQGGAFAPISFGKISRRRPR